MIRINDKIPGAPHFTWHEFIWLRDPDVNIHVLPEPEIYNNIIKTAKVMEEIRAVFDRIIWVTSGYRPAFYNRAVGGSMNSMHLRGLACDFKVDKMSAQSVRDILEPMLLELEIRMEDHEGDWNHIDLKSPGDGNRFFKP